MHQPTAVVPRLPAPQELPAQELPAQEGRQRALAPPPERPVPRAREEQD